MPKHASTDSKPVTIHDFLAAKTAGKRLAMLTAYDFTMARLIDLSGVDGILVGDSLGMVMQGNETSLSVSMTEMTYHTRMVARGVRRCLLVSDMPFMSYHLSPQQALENAGRLVQQGGAHAVKLEGGRRSVEAMRAIVDAEIPVMGHVGLTPQSIRKLGGFRVQRDELNLLDDAKAVEQAGAFAVVVECVPSNIAEKITKSISIPTIGIGAGPSCDGQILVSHDVFGLYQEFRPKFVKTYADLGTAVKDAVATYCKDVRDGAFPGPEQSFK
jgi:3-methyl-2-oxobutanoate hydroxymethyltransferase